MSGACRPEPNDLCTCEVCAHRWRLSLVDAWTGERDGFDGFPVYCPTCNSYDVRRTASKATTAPPQP
jgi:hypothetical protein